MKEHNYLISLSSWQGVLDTTLCDKVRQWLAAGWWFSPGTPVSSINKSDRHDITEILFKVAIDTINQTKLLVYHWYTLSWLGTGTSITSGGAMLVKFKRRKSVSLGNAWRNELWHIVLSMCCHDIQAVDKCKNILLSSFWMKQNNTIQ